MYGKNTEPQGTPTLIAKKSDEWSVATTVLINTHRFGGTPYVGSLLKSAEYYSNTYTL